MVQLWQQDGRLLLHLNGKAGTPHLAKEGFSTHLSNKMLWRCFVLRRADRLIQTSLPYSDRLELTTELAFKAASPLFILILILGLLVLVRVKRGLRPLKKIDQRSG